MKPESRRCPKCERVISRKRRDNKLHHVQYFPCGCTVSNERDWVLKLLDDSGWALNTAGAVPVIQGGIYDGQALYVPHFWRQETDYLSSVGQRTVHVHIVNAVEASLFPELGNKTSVRLAFTPDLQRVEEL